MLDKSIPQEKLAAELVINDPRITQAKKLILETISEHQQQINGIRPPCPARKVTYDKILDEYGKMRGGNLWYPYLGSGIGNGPLVELLDGSVKYDFISGIGVHYWGHSNLEIINSSVDAAIKNTTMQGHLQQNVDSVHLTKLLLEASGMDHCFLTTSGAMANENALKILFQNRQPANRVLAFEGCFAGRTLAIASITDKPKYRDGLPTTLSVDYVPFYDYRSPEESTDLALKVLKGHLKRYPNQHAAMIFELVQGEGGCYPGEERFFRALMEELVKHHVKIFIDEVQTFGRLPELFAYQYFKLDQYVDIVTIGKLSQVCATLFRKELKPKAGLLSQTFTGSSSQISAGEVIISNLIQGDYFGSTGKIQTTHNYFVKGLKDIESRYPHLLSGPWGIGAMIAFTPLDGEPSKVMKISQKLFEEGVISFVTGEKPMRIRFLIPIGAIQNSDIDEVLSIIEKTLSLPNEPG